MITVRVDTNGIERRLQAIAREQVPFATALALTRTAQDVAKALADEMPRYLQQPTPFSLKAWAIERATKQTLAARVYAREAQGKYLKFQIEGGSRPPARKLQRLPDGVSLDQYGNMPKGMLKQLIDIARNNRRLTVAGARRQVATMKRAGVSAALNLFYGDPGNGRPVGIYKRVKQGDREVLVPLVLMPTRNFKYSPRFPARQIVAKAARAAFPGRFRDALRQALASAK